MPKGDKVVCPRCGAVVGDLGRHLRRNRCRHQHVRKYLKRKRGVRG